jgi:transposase InsO family protein
VPWEHQKIIEDHVDELLKAGCIRTSRSPYNAPVFCVQKQGGGMRVVLDYRGLNYVSYEDKYVIREIQECIDQIGRNDSKIFSALDLTSGFWQMELEEQSRHLTAFTVKGRGRFEWITAPMGLKGSPASFARLMDIVMEGLKDVLAYIDDLLVHTKDHEQHLVALEQVFQRLAKYNLKLNMEKCHFAASELPYLGFTIGEHGIKPQADKLQAIREWPIPDTQRRVRQFLGMTNYFRHFIKNYAQIAGHLSALTRIDGPWKKGPLPDKALQAFHYLQRKLCTAPVLTYPRADRPFILSVDAATGDDKERGGMGAVLLQADDAGREQVIAYASASLDKHERNYSPFLLEMAACSWAVDHFRVYLKGRSFILQTDHKPVEKMSKMHKKTLNRLQEQMSEFAFVVQHKPGEQNVVADALSRNVAGVASMTFQPREMFHLQQQDPLCSRVAAALLSATLPTDSREARDIQTIANRCFIKDGLLRVKWNSKTLEDRAPLLAPQVIRQEVLRAAHASRFAGHGGQFRTFNTIIRTYWWPGLQAEVNEWVRTCPICQESKNPKQTLKVPLRPLEVLDRPNVRIHCDLFGPARTSDRGNKFILVMTDAFTKYAELVAIPDKEAATVAKAIMERWICRFSSPKTIVTDQGREFVNKLTDEMFHKFGIAHNITSAMHPAANSAAESFNREIARYMKVVLDDNQTLEWEEWLPMLAISYNTQVHKSVMNSPFFLTFLHDPNLPYFDMEDSRPSYGESWPAEAFQRLRKSYLLAQQQNLEQNRLMKEYFDKSTEERKFQVGEKVLVYYPRSTVRKGNPKFTPPWKSGCYIHQQVAPDSYWIRQIGTNTKGTVVHASRIKRFVTNQPQTAIMPTIPNPDITPPNHWRTAVASTPGQDSTRFRAQPPRRAQLRQQVSVPTQLTQEHTQQNRPTHQATMAIPAWLEWGLVTAAQQAQPAAGPAQPAAGPQGSAESDSDASNESESDSDHDQGPGGPPDPGEGTSGNLRQEPRADDSTDSETDPFHGFEEIAATGGNPERQEASKGKRAARAIRSSPKTKSIIQPMDPIREESETRELEGFVPATPSNASSTEDEFVDCSSDTPVQATPEAAILESSPQAARQAEELESSSKARHSATGITQANTSDCGNAKDCSDNGSDRKAHAKRGSNIPGLRGTPELFIV